MFITILRDISLRKAVESDLRLLAKVFETALSNVAINFIIISRDITADVQLRQEVLMAGQIQRSSLHPDQDTELFISESIFKPYHYVSGDFYFYNWDSEEQILSGFMLDVMGHGLATALQISALHVLFRQAMARNLPVRESLAWINSESTQFFVNGSFGAAIAFNIDLAGNRLVLGIKTDEIYDDIVVAVEPGDTLIFLTDGL